MKVRYLLSMMQTLKIPGFISLMKDWQAFLRMHFIYAAIESGLLNALRSAATRGELIRKLSVVRAELLDALLEVGLATGELSCNNGAFTIKGKRSKAMLGKDGDMLSAMVQATNTYYHTAYLHAADCMRGAPLGDDLVRIGDLVARFSKIGEPILKKFIASLVTGGRAVKVLDVGCGSGIYLQAVFKANPEAGGIGIDLDEAVAEKARENIKRWDLGGRFRVLAGDIRFLRDDLDGPFDLVLLLNLLYYFPVDERLPLLSRLRSLLSSNGRLAIAMHFQGEGRDLGAANLNLVNCSLKGLTPLPHLSDVVDLLKDAGFSRIRKERLIPGSAFYGLAAGRG
jgi:SAM-dependent methyltransferase